MLLSEERRHSLRESKRARDFELIQNFSNKINSALLESNLYKETQNLFNRYFFTKGFISAKDHFKEGLTFSTHF